MTTGATRGKALVTGSSSGIGAAICERLLEEGFSVVGLSRTPGAMRNAAFEHLEVDFSALDTLPDRLAEIVSLHPDVEVVVLNAGRGAFGSLEEFSFDQMRALMDLNFHSQAYVSRAFMPLLKRRGGGHLVFLGSEAAYRGTARGAVYCASKFALRGFAQSLRQEGSSRGVRVSFISPGMTRTPFYDSLSFEPGEEPEHALAARDVAEAVALAVSMGGNAVLEELRLSPLKHVVRHKSRSD